ncbi:MAG TPA: MBL fold metallo-hydrolase, partial [Chitinophagaceae bacterium]|nr:MBL fold metallo-hydrolase [Chitinophagaceae bacterium]
APGVWGMKDVFVNVYMINNPAENNWVLVDAGLKWSAPKIKNMAAVLFGAGSKPASIVLTHGHFDHVGSLAKLAGEWDVPVYAHHLEIPYLTGISSYPPPDPSVGGGLMAEMAFLYPKGPINIEEKVIALPQGGRIPGLPDWTYIHTPGHAPGHISLFRESDKVLIAGDAFVTTKQESALSVMLQTRKLSGPPKYFTSDWSAAASSVALLDQLEPEIVATGHGRPMRGEAMRKSLHNLAVNFQTLAVPTQGRYTHQPALMDDSGVVHIPPKNVYRSTAPTLKILGITAAVLITMMLFGSGKKKKLKAKKLKEEADRADYQITDAKEDAKDRAKKKLADKIDSAKSAKNKFEDDLKDEWGDFKQPLKKGIADMKKSGKKEYESAKKHSKEGYEDGKEYAKDNLKDGKKSIKAGFEDGKKTAKEGLEDGKKFARDSFEHGKKDVKEGFEDGKKTAKDGLESSKKYVEDEYESGKKYVKGGLEAGRKTIKEGFENARDTTLDEYESARKKAKEEYRTAKRKAREQYENARKTVKHEVRDIKDPIIEKLTSLKFPVKKEVRKIKRMLS